MACGLQVVYKLSMVWRWKKLCLLLFLYEERIKDILNSLSWNPHSAVIFGKPLLEAIYPKPRVTISGEVQQKYPYLLRDVPIERVNQVWSTDITYIRLTRGFIYLVAIVDWFSRYILSWEISTTLDISFCLEELERHYNCKWIYQSLEYKTPDQIYYG